MKIKNFWSFNRFFGLLLCVVSVTESKTDFKLLTFALTLFFLLYTLHNQEPFLKVSKHKPIIFYFLSSTEAGSHFLLSELRKLSKVSSYLIEKFSNSALLWNRNSKSKRDELCQHKIDWNLDSPSHQFLLEDFGSVCLRRSDIRILGLSKVYQ